MRWAWIMLVCGGCTMLEAEGRLVEQARRGVGLVEAGLRERESALERLAAVQRHGLDEAFDQDVRQRAALDAGWVIEHRRAYAAALEALARQREASAAAARADRSNLLAVDAALRRLAWLHSVRAGWWRTVESLGGMSDGEDRPEARSGAGGGGGVGGVPAGASAAGGVP